jgi:cytochrome c553
MRLFSHLAGCCALALLAGAAASKPTIAADSDASRAKHGLEIAPVKLKLKGLDRGLVGLGSYFVNAVGGCNDCHSVETYAPGGNPFEGEPEKINEETYLAGGQEFGPFISPNLTPDESGRPAGLTYKKFFNAIRFGKDPDEPGELLKIMPWPVYSKLQDRDIRAVYEYLKAVPSIESQPTLTAEPEVTEPETTEPETTTGEVLPPTEEVEETTEPTGDVTEPPTETEDTTETGEPTDTE